MRNAANASKIDRWAKRYRTALRQTIFSDSAPDFQPAHKLGRQALDLSLETLDLAVMHEKALPALLSPDGSALSRRQKIKRAKRFFAETVVPIDKTHRAALETDVRVGELTKTLRTRTAESISSTLHLKQGIASRQEAEAAVEKSGKLRALLLKESVNLRKLLRDRKREILLAQEAERKKNSRLLHEDVAQILLDINFKLLALKTVVRGDTRKLKKEVAETQRLVKQSSTMLKHFDHKFGGRHEP